MLSGESHGRCISRAPSVGNSRQHPLAGGRMCASHIGDTSLTALEPREVSGRYQPRAPKIRQSSNRAHRRPPTQSDNSARRRVRPASGDRARLPPRRAALPLPAPVRLGRYPRGRGVGRDFVPKVSPREESATRVSGVHAPDALPRPETCIPRRRDRRHAWAACRATREPAPSGGG